MYPIQSKCKTYLNGHYRMSLSDEISFLKEFTERNNVSLDYYGDNDFISEFQKKVADLLGFESTLFFPTGTMAQQILLKINAEKTKSIKFGIHEKSHIYAFEDKAYHYLHGLKEVLVGKANEPFLVGDIESLSDRISTLVLDIPYRELGGILTPWKELERIKNYCKENNILLHADGARLWECAHYYKKSYKEICDGLDSVYVSLYKGIGGMAGCFLCSDMATIKEAKKWKKRHGGKLFQESMLMASAAYQFDKRINEMPKYFRKTQEIYNTCSEFDELTFYPKEPFVNLFHIHMKISVEEAVLMKEYFLKHEGLWLFNNVFESQLRDHKSYFEIYVGDILLDKSIAEIKKIFESLVRYVKSL